MATKIIHLYGALAELHPGPIKVEAESVHEAISALQLYPAFNPKTGKKFPVKIDGFDSVDSIYEKTDVEEFHVRPVVTGGGGNKGGWIQVVIGVIMIVVGFIMWNPTLILQGAVMVLGGVLQLLAPQPKLDGMGKVGEEDRTRYLGARGNTVAIGTRIPMIYGRRKFFGHYLSFDVDAVGLHKAPAEWYASSFTDFGETTYAAAPEAEPIGDPATVDSQPIVYFNSLVGDVVNFTPSVFLAAGQHDITFNNGRTLHVLNETAGVTNQLTVLGGNTSDLPPTGTPFTITTNYV